MKQFLLMIAVVLVGCGGDGKKEVEQQIRREIRKPSGELTKADLVENLSGTYERVDGLRFKLVIENSGTFKSYFHNFPSNTFVEQASGKCKIVGNEVHFHYQTPADYANAGLVHIFRVKQDGGLSQITGISNDVKRHNLSKKEQAETLDWNKK